MAQHGYLREYDEDFEGDDDRERGDWRERDERDWRSRERGRRFMFGDEDRERFRERDEDRGFFSRIGDEARSWFHDDDDYRERRGERGFEGRRSFSSHPDDHYRSWRDRQLQALDRDYADYCREREQQFHSDFDAWRDRRQGNPQPLQPGMTQSGLSSDPTGELQLRTEAQSSDAPDPMATATLGTTSGGRKRV